jgi:hypothetical protein
MLHVHSTTDAQALYQRHYDSIVVHSLEGMKAVGQIIRENKCIQRLGADDVIVRSPATFAALYQLEQDIQGPVEDIPIVLQDSEGACFPWREYEELHAARKSEDNPAPITTEFLLKMVAHYGTKGKESDDADMHTDALLHYAMRNTYQDLYDKFEWLEDRPHARGMIMNQFRVTEESLQTDDLCKPMMELYQEAIRVLEARTDDVIQLSIRPHYAIHLLRALYRTRTDEEIIAEHEEPIRRLAYEVESIPWEGTENWARELLPIDPMHSWPDIRPIQDICWITRPWDPPCYRPVQYSLNVFWRAENIHSHDPVGTWALVWRQWVGPIIHEGWIHRIREEGVAWTYWQTHYYGGQASPLPL